MKVDKFYLAGRVSQPIEDQGVKSKVKRAVLDCEGIPGKIASMEKNGKSNGPTDAWKRTPGNREENMAGACVNDGALGNEKVPGTLDGIKHVAITCPVCLARRVVPFKIARLHELIGNSGDSLVKFVIPPGRVCEHGISITLDAHFLVRGIQSVEGDQTL